MQNYVNDFDVKKMIFPGGRKLDKSIKLSRAKETRLKSNMFSEIKEKQRQALIKLFNANQNVFKCP